jgi:hypothetical protein
MQYVQCDNAVFVHNLYQELRGKRLELGMRDER